jgi:hypothetical protein
MLHGRARWVCAAAQGSGTCIYVRFSLLVQHLVFPGRFEAIPRSEEGRKRPLEVPKVPKIRTGHPFRHNPCLLMVRFLLS